MESNNQKITLNKNKVQNRMVYFNVKRMIDILFSILGLVVLSPVFLIISLLIKFDGSHGKVIYSQIRVGKNQKKFKMYKFRSMVPDADEKLKQLVKMNEVNGAMFKIKNDPRITKIGHFIRKYSLDELPQLFNVVKGDMSLVGPRPPLVNEVAEYTDYDMQRLLVTPGCTGLWQVTDRNNTDFAGAVKLDLEYIQKSSLWFDFKIILNTIKIMIKPNSAY